MGRRQGRIVNRDGRDDRIDFVHCKRLTAGNSRPLQNNGVILPQLAARPRPGYYGDQAARTESRNLETSTLRRLLSPESICAADSTCAEADPVSFAPR